jgi:hypothetical protein
LIDLDATFFTICNEPYFPGTVALLNSLRLTGNSHPLVVLDIGLSGAQRSRLEDHASIVEIPVELKTHAMVFKAFPYFFRPSGVTVMIDSDMIVTRALSDILGKAAEGKICVFPDHFTQSRRYFAQWETFLALRTPLRRQRYVNAGFICVSTTHWPGFLERFWRLSERIPLDAPFGPDPDHPFWAGDQDVLNAILMSEIPADAIEIGPDGSMVHADGLPSTEIVDAKTLRCLLNGQPTSILHYGMGPKAWDARAWIRVRADAYVKLFGRVTCAADVPLRLDPDELPLWLRPTMGGRAALAALDVAHRSVAQLRRHLPPGAAARVSRMTQRLARQRPT